MTERKNINNYKKLILGSSKLILRDNSIYPKKVTKTLSDSGSIVVEVKRGKSIGRNLFFNRDSKRVVVDQEQDSRRLVALQESKRKDKVNKDNDKLNTLSKLAEINQKGENSSEEGQKNSVVRKGDVPIEKDISTKKDLSKGKYDQKENCTKKIEQEKVILSKLKKLEPKKLKKSDIIQMLDQDSGNIPFKIRSLASIKRARAKERKKPGNVKVEKIYREVILPEIITVAELAGKMTERASDVTRELMKFGVMATSTQSIDADTAELVITSFGHFVKRVKESDIENVLRNKKDTPENLVPRAPIVTVMGHVDHGKTSLLDALKSTNIVGGEAGGITQHIGAYTVTISDNKMITFIDTPGHEAFTEMRARGAQATDIVVLVVAADDGIKTQTIEAISHAKVAGVPIIVAINKIDKPEANIDRVKNGLLSHELILEDFGGDVITVAVSALKKQNLDKLEEAILLVAEMQELKANPNRLALGVVVEVRVDSGKGIIATVIVQNGTLKKSDIVIAGTSYGRVKRICNDKGLTIVEAGPSFAVEIFGLNGSLSAGDIFNVVETDKQAKDIVQYRIRKAKDCKVTSSKTSLEDLFLKASGDEKIKKLPIIIKGDVHGSIEAIISNLNKIENDQVKPKILHSAVGGISESDIILAKASSAIVLGFNVRSNNAVAVNAEANNIDIRHYSIIYNLIDDVKSIMGDMLSPIIREEYIGSVDIREVFNVSKIGRVGGSYVTKGIIKRGVGVRLLRDDVVVYEGKLKTLRRFKEDVKEVREGFECGIVFENYDDIKVGDKVEVFEIVKK